jgi:disulfide bond formation protein DsbB
MVEATSPRLLVVLLLIASAAIVGSALLSQYVGGLQPCELCLYERWPYYAAIVATTIALLSGGDRAMRAVVSLCALLFAASTALAFYHVGVEQHWFAGPSACTGSVAGATSIEALKAQLLARQPVSCDAPSWTLFGVSLAGLNVIASALLTFACAAAVVRGGRR